MVDLSKPPYQAEEPLIRPIQLVTGTLLAKDLVRTRRFYEDVLGLECASCGPDRMLARSRQGRLLDAPKWVLEVRESKVIANPQRLLHHWGIDLVSKAAVDDMNRRLKEKQAEYGLGTVLDVQFQHGAYAFYFSDFDSNWWEFQFSSPQRYEKKFERGDAL